MLHSRTIHSIPGPSLRQPLQGPGLPGKILQAVRRRLVRTALSTTWGWPSDAGCFACPCMASSCRNGKSSLWHPLRGGALWPTINIIVSLPHLGAVLNKRLGVRKVLLNSDTSQAQRSTWRGSTKFSTTVTWTLWKKKLSHKDKHRVEVLFVPLAVTGYVKNITKVLKRCQILEWKEVLLIRANNMVSVTNESYVKMFIT
jgi:hypothetical protein